MAHYDGHVEAAREQYIAKLEARVRELEASLFAATATVASLEAKLRQVEEERGGEVLFGQLCSRLIRHITSTDAKCDPPTDIELRLVSIIRERDQARAALRVLVEFFASNHEDAGLELYGRVDGKELSPSGEALNKLIHSGRRALREG